MPLSRDLPGTWLLRSRIDTTREGAVHPDPLLGHDPVALLVYDRTGHFAAQFMKRDRSAPSAAARPNATNNTRAQSGYDAYFGTYTVDDAKGTVTQQLMGALSPRNVGMVLTRAMDVRGDTLTIRLETEAADGTPIVRTLTWERLEERADLRRTGRPQPRPASCEVDVHLAAVKGEQRHMPQADRACIDHA